MIFCQNNSDDLWVGEAKSSSGCVPILSERPADQAWARQQEEGD